MVAGKSDGTGNVGHCCCGRTGRVIDRIGVLLRCVIVGFLTLFVWVIAAGGGGGGSIWVALAGAMVCGLLIYSLHVCFLARLWRRCFLRSHLGKDKHPWISKEQRKLAEGSIDILLLNLSVSRLKRRISSDAETRSVQKGLDRWRGMLGFLYCAAYVLIVVPPLTLCDQFDIVGSKLLPHLAALGGITLFAAMISDYSETWHELWASATYKDGKKAKATRPRKRSK